MREIVSNSDLEGEIQRDSRSVENLEGKRGRNIGNWREIVELGRENHRESIRGNLKHYSRISIILNPKPSKRNNP